MPKTPDASPKSAGFKPLATVDDLLAQPPDRVEALCDDVVKRIEATAALLPSMVALSRDERRSTTGKLGVEELPELEALLDTVDAQPSLFVAMAARDNGSDPARVETAPTRKAIQVLRALDRVSRAVRALDVAVSDARLRVGERVREVTVTARVIAKANAAVNPGVRAGLAKVETLRGGRVKPRAAKKATPTGGPNG